MSPSITDTASGWKIHPYGHAGVLVSPTTGNSLIALSALDHHLQSSSIQGLTEWVVGYDSVLLLFDRPMDHALVSTLLGDIPASDPQNEEPEKIHRIEVRYDGPDIAEIAKATNLETEEVIRLHSAPIYRVRFLGFAPGFAYLDGLHPSLHLPRRATPRPQMNAGAVAIGGAHAGIYSTPTPGGWNWLGNTDYPLFQPESEKPFTLTPGDGVQFIAVS